MNLITDWKMNAEEKKLFTYNGMRIALRLHIFICANKILIKINDDVHFIPRSDQNNESNNLASTSSKE